MSRVFFESDLDTVATFWRIFRKDGAALGFTTHDRDLWFDGLLHRAAPGMVPSSIRRTADLQDDSVEVEGALSHDSIAAADLMGGLYDEAQIAIGAVDWEGMDASVLYRGTIAGVTREGGGFAARLRSSKAQLAVDPVPRTSPTCRARFCDRGCALSPVRFTHRSAALAFDPDDTSVTFDTLPAVDFEQGELRWLGGPQTGLRCAVLRQEGNVLALDRPVDPATEPGTRVLLREGCDHTIATCTSRFGNAANFQGEPYLPGNDFLAQYPVQR